MTRRKTRRRSENRKRCGEIRNKKDFTFYVVSIFVSFRKESIANIDFFLMI
jgi:hypothetical protein